MNPIAQKPAESPWPSRSPSIGPAPSPFWPGPLVSLFIRPRDFFKTNLALGRTPYVFVATWCYGIADTIGRLDDGLMRSELGRPRPGWEQVAPYIVHSWLGFWLCILAVGALGGLFLWWLGGWWYRVRLRWSGAVAPDKRLARLVLVYSSFVFSGPAVALALVQTVLYPHYAAAYASEDWYSVALALPVLIFPYWSIVTSYVGVRTLFQVTKWKALLWFAALPVVINLLFFGGIVLLFSLFG